MLIDSIVRFFASLRLTVVLLSLSLVLVFLGTMAQEPLGLYITQEEFFQSRFVGAAPMSAAIRKALQMFHIYVAPMTAAQVLSAPWIPVFPGGYLVGSLLLVNVITAYVTRHRFTWRHSGLLMIHVGLVMLLVGQLATDMLAKESHMRLIEGEPKNYSESGRVTELVFVTAADQSGQEDIVALPESLLARKKEINNPRLPCQLRVVRYLQNARVAQRAPMVDQEPAAATKGIGASVKVTEVQQATRMEERDLPAAVIELLTPQGSLGTWLVSAQLDELQPIQVGGKTWRVGLRFARFYKPFSLELLKFSHDKYPGSEIPRNFSSRVRILHPGESQGQEALIYMNNPLRRGGETFYQSGFDENDPRVTILQVVRNPGWLTPYFGCVIVGLGMLVQFSYSLVEFAQKRRPA